VIAESQLKTPVILDEVRAGGRIPLIIGRGLTAKAREALGLPVSTLFRLPQSPADSRARATRWRRRWSAAPAVCPKARVRPGTYCEPKMTTVGSQDTTGPMTRDELKDLACLGFSADLVMQSSATPPPIRSWSTSRCTATLPSFISTRGGVSLRPGDGVIHSWLNRLLLPDTVGTGGDSHTRFPIGISFPAGSGLVAFAAATGVMPLDMPESVLVRFKGTIAEAAATASRCATWSMRFRYYAIKQGLLTVEKKGKKNIFSGRILEIEGLPGSEGRAGVRAVRRLRRTFGRRLHGAARQGADHRVHELEHHADEVDDRQRLLRTRARWVAASRRWKRGSPTRTAQGRRRRRIRGRDRDRPGRHQGADRRLPERPGRREAAVGSCRRPRSTKCSSVRA
jgi:hypothetical protein